LALPQDVQAEAYDYPEAFFAPTLIRIRAPAADPAELDVAAQLLRAAKQPVIVAGGGVLYSDGGAEALRAFAEAHRVPVARRRREELASLGPPAAARPVGVTGSTAANTLAHDADLVLAVGTRLSDFTTGSHSLFAQAKIVAVNVNAFDALKWRATTVAGRRRRWRSVRSARACRAGQARCRGRRKRRARPMPGARAVSAIVGVRELEPGTLPYDGK
jgi:3D-(3,5/4)-trihydroxycyclohexane-1,2-dione acylhydrolase (decyclizing)